jgi:hypothetical protein
LAIFRRRGFITRKLRSATQKGEPYGQSSIESRSGLSVRLTIRSGQGNGLAGIKFSRLVNGRIVPRPEDAKLIHQKLGVELSSEPVEAGRVQS